MNPEVIRVSESLAALLAAEGFLSGVRHHVIFEAPGPGEGSVALVALVRPLPGVAPHVELQVGQLGEALPADADEGLVSGVGPVVDAQVLGAREGLLAAIAAVSASVGVHTLVV